MNLSHQDRKEARDNLQRERKLKITQISIPNHPILPVTTFMSLRDFITNLSLDICQYPIITISIMVLDSCHSSNLHSRHIIIIIISSLQSFLLIINTHLLRGILLLIGNMAPQTFNRLTTTGSMEEMVLQLTIVIWMVLIVITFPLEIILNCQQFIGARLDMKDYLQIK